MGVMEQQTISIAKAGIMTTLNARVSILAAANPAYGRYNHKKSITQNIQLPAALLSRFDLLWLIADKFDRENDLRLARHITYVHQNNTNPPQQYTPLDMSLMRRYIAMCQKQVPLIPPELRDYIVGCYCELRKESRAEENKNTTTSRGQQEVDRVYQFILQIAEGSKTIKVQDIRDRATSKGFKPDAIDRCLEEYESLDVWQLNQARSKLTIINNV